jgi:hypothetical protein
LKNKLECFKTILGEYTFFMEKIAKQSITSFSLNYDYLLLLFIKLNQMIYIVAMTLSITVFSITTVSIIGLVARLSILIQHYKTQRYGLLSDGLCCYAEYGFAYVVL